MSDNAAVSVSRVIDAPREEVFRAWTDPEEIKRWFGPGEFHTPEADVDLRPGGSYRFVMHPPEGNPMPISGTYQEIDAPERLVYTWKWEVDGMGDTESLVEVEFRDAGEDRTEVVITHSRYEEAHTGEPYRMGWEGGLDKVEAMFTKAG
jgi:uncharacterized protein YndB with AHSA1/START domain